MCVSGNVVVGALSVVPNRAHKFLLKCTEVRRALPGALVPLALVNEVSRGRPNQSHC